MIVESAKRDHIGNMKGIAEREMSSGKIELVEGNELVYGSKNRSCDSKEPF